MYRTLLLLGGLSVAALGTASAQWDPQATASLGQMMGPLNLSIGNMSLSRNSLAQSGRQPSPPAGQGGLGRNARLSTPHSLTFVPNAQVRAELRQKVMGNMLAHTAPEKRVDVGRVLARVNPPAEIGKVIAQNGYSPTNLADVMAMWWIASWQIVHNQSDDPPPQVIRAVVNQSGRGLLSTAGFVGLPGAEKQRMAEVMLYQLYFSAGEFKVAQKHMTNTPPEAVQTQVAKQFQQLAGIDLNALTLTPQGFARK